MPVGIPTTPGEPFFAHTDFRALLGRSLLALAAGLVAVAICYFWVDRPVAFYVHDQGIEKIKLFKWLTYPPPWVQSWSPLVLVLLMMRRALGPLDPWQKTLFVACLSVLVANEFRTSLGDLCGRYWPETWFDDNPSLIGTGKYGFHPFVHGDDIGSFPSGHAARILAFAAVWWVAIPRSRVLCALLALPMLASLVAMDYHFVSDVIAGSVVGGIIGVFGANLADLARPACDEQRKAIG
ncbi:MAG: phosphatase PAP2 family protein [Singulisphaera sp.]